VGVTVKFSCGGCDATAYGTAALRMEFRSFSGRRWGFGSAIPSNTVEDVTPEGWVAFDPWTHATYCPECWASILRDEEDAEHVDAETINPGKDLGGPT